MAAMYGTGGNGVVKLIPSVEVVITNSNPCQLLVTSQNKILKVNMT